MQDTNWLEIRPESPHTGDREQRILCGRDKSLTHRAIIFASIAEGESLIEQALLGQDCISTLNIFRSLGVQAELSEAASIRIHSQGLRHFKNPSSPVDCGNSGTTARLLCGLFAAIPGLAIQLTGDESLSTRPMRRVVDPLKKWGAKIDGPQNAEFLPLSIQGTQLKLSGNKVEIDKASAQIKSALILAATQISGKLELSLPAGARDHTEIMIRRFGGICESYSDGASEHIVFQGPWQPGPFHCRVPVDPSSAAFFAVYGLLRSSAGFRLPEVLANPTRLGFLNALQRMSQKVQVVKPLQSTDLELESTCDLVVAPDPDLQGIEITGAEVPSLVDEIPILAVAAAFANGSSSYFGLSELRVKESDRLAKTAELLELAGAKVRIEGDNLHIAGGLNTARAFAYDPVGDHRLAMAAAILAKRADGPCRIKGASCASVSFPNFYDELARVSSS